MFGDKISSCGQPKQTKLKKNNFNNFLYAFFIITCFIIPNSNRFVLNQVSIYNKIVLYFRVF